MNTLFRVSYVDCKQTPSTLVPVCVILMHCNHKYAVVKVDSFQGLVINYFYCSSPGPVVDTSRGVFHS